MLCAHGYHATLTCAVARIGLNLTDDGRDVGLGSSGVGGAAAGIPRTPPATGGRPGYTSLLYPATIPILRLLCLRDLRLSCG